MEGLERASLAQAEAALPLTLPAATDGDVDVCVLQFGRCVPVLADSCLYTDLESTYQTFSFSALQPSWA
jgi:hypothetical protein